MRVQKFIVLVTLVTSGLVAAQGCASSERTFTKDDAAAPLADAPFVIIAPNDAPTPATNAEVFGHSDSTLYKLNPESKSVTVVGNFVDCDQQILDIALDEKSVMYGAGDTALYRIDRTTARCQLVQAGQKYPNSLSFVPAGTVDPNVEALVGFVDALYYRIDTATGAKTQIGTLGPVYESSGDIVSVKGGGTFLTIKNNGCNDCLVEIDPKTGSIKKNFGSLGYTDVFGLTFWGGSAYGFTTTGQLFEVQFVPSGVGTTAIPIPQAPSSLSFWGAGSTTSAPLTPIR